MNAAVHVEAAQDRDRGAALIVAIGFVLMISMIGAGLTSMITSGVGNRAALERIRDRQYAADGAIEQAIAAVSGELELAAITCGDERSDALVLNDIEVRVDTLLTCGATLDAGGLPISQTAGVFTACADLGTPCADDEAVVRALIGFELVDGSSGVDVDVIVHSWSVLR